MQQLIELYDMVALNENALRETERLTILRARIALAMFENAMQSFKALAETADCQATNASAKA
jgi:hypothetical protein